MNGLRTRSGIPIFRGRTPGARHRLLRPALVLVAVAVTLVPSMVALPGTLASPAGPLAARPAASPSVPASIRSLGGGAPGLPHAAPPVTPGPPPASGRGTFFTNSLMPPVAANQTCLGIYTSKYCVNITNDPSINLTSGGVLGVAYTAFVNAAACGGAMNNTTTLIGFQRSTNLGSSWSNPVYIGNTNCTNASRYASAENPSLTSLANGTLVLTYVQFSNFSYYSGYYTFPPYLEPQFTPYDRLVVQESYNGGVAWTAPAVLAWDNNSGAGYYSSSPGSPPYRDWVTATGQTIYVVWENLTDPDYQNSPYFSSQVHVRASTDGGQTWGKVTNLPATPGKYGGYSSFQKTQYAVNPFVLAAPNGEVYLAYSTGWTYDYSKPYCAPYPPYACGYGVYTDDIVVANSSTNGTSWTVRMAATNVTTQEYYQFRPSGIFHDPSPQLAWSTKWSQLYLAYAGTVVGDYCNNPYASYGGCVIGGSTPDVFVQNSSNGGRSWSAPSFLASLVNPQNGTMNQAYQPAISADAGGTLHLAATWSNYSECGAITVTYYVCGQVTKVYLNSTDNGSTFTSPLLVMNGGSIDPDEYDGEYSTMVAAGSRLFFAWSDPACPTPGGCGYPYAATGTATVVVSQPFAGTGVTLSFSESNLSAGLRWGVDVMGNLRSAFSGTGLSVTGVPTGTPIDYSVSWVNLSSGVSYEPTVNPASPATLTANLAVTAKYAEFVVLDIKSVPAWPSYGYPQPADWNITPSLGVHWFPVNSTQTLWANYTPPSCGGVYCDYANLSFLSWTGSGVGSRSTNSTTFTLKLRSGVVETANFLFIGQCSGYGTIACVNLTGYSLAFVERGLPSGTTWSVTLDGATTTSSSGSVIGFSVAVAPVTYTVWTVPAKGGKYWVPTEDASSPLEVPATSRVDVTYTLESPAAASFDLNLSQAGLPNGTTWSAVVGGTGYSVGPHGLDLSLPGGSSELVNASFVYTQSGVGYYATNVSFTRYVENFTGTRTANVPASVPLNGSLALTVHFLPMYWLTMTGTAGGSVSPASRWVPSGGAVAISATPASGYYFLTWSGTGTGATSGSQNLQPNVTIHVGGPVTESAEFLPIPPVTWNVTVIAGGLPNGTALEVTFAGTSYAGVGSLDIPRILTGSYSVSFPDVYLNASASTRFVPTSVASTFPEVSGQYRVASNGTFWVNYSTQFALTVSASFGGTTSPSPGVYWQANGTAVALSATPSYHYRFVGWNGSGNGALRGTAPSGTVPMTGPISEAAQFAWRVFPPPAVFTVRFNESGLPTAARWAVAVGTTGASGASATLSVAGLNGTYTLDVPPVYYGSATRYVVDASTPSSITVQQNGSVVLNFTEEFLLTIVVGEGGTTSVTTTWEPAGAQVTLSATPQGGWQFVVWNGSGAGNYSGGAASAPVTVNGPITEAASFAPVTAVPHAASSNAGETTAFGLLAVGLVLGLAAAILLARRRRTPPPEYPEEGTSPEGDGADASGEPVAEEPAPYDDAGVGEYPTPPEPDPDPSPYSLPLPEPAPYDESVP